MAKTKKPNPYTTQAQADAVVRFGPEYSALTALLRDAEDRRDTMLTQAKTTRQGTVGAVTAALPQVTQAYQGAQQAVTPAFAGGGGVEASALQARLGESAAQARTQLQARRVGAVEGEGAARSAALRDYASDKTKIGQRALDLGNEQGAFITGEMGDLSSADAKATAQANELQARLNQDERSSVRSSGIDPDTGQPIPGGKLDPKVNAPKPKWRTPQQHADFASQVSNIASFAAKWKGHSRSFIVGKLKQGRPQMGGWADPNTGQPVAAGTPGAVPYSLPAVPSFKADLAMSAALDIALAGHLSKTTEQRIHASRLKISQLGLQGQTYGEYVKRQMATAQRTRPAGTNSIRDIYG